MARSKQPLLAAGLYAIPARRAFVDALAEGLLAAFATDEPEALARVRVLLPTRRACRSLQETFLRLGQGQAVILPRLQPLGDVDEEELLLDDAVGLGDAALDLPPAITPLRRVALLAETISELKGTDGNRIEGAHAVKLAQDLSRFLDQVQTEGLDLARLGGLVPDLYTEHWQKVLAFLALLQDAWPARLAAEGLMDPAARRKALVEALAKSWQEDPPADPVVLAGSTGSLPATASLIETVSTLPQGYIVLAGLDREASDETWAAILDDASSPQHGLALLLARLGKDREAVQDWPFGKDGSPAAREALLNLALTPAQGVAAWREKEIKESLTPGLKGLSLITCETPAEEARVIALGLRQALEKKQARAALVTPDRNLARRVAGELRRWGVDVDDSAGQPLLASGPGRYLRSLATALSVQMAPVALLAALKHPLAAAGLDPVTWQRLVLLAEKTLLRGLKPPPGLAGLTQSLETWSKHHKTREKDLADLADLGLWFKQLALIWDPATRLFSASSAPFTDLLGAHLRLAEGLAASDRQGGPARLWRGDEAEALATFLADLSGATGGKKEIAPSDYAGLFIAFAAEQASRSRVGRHPRLSILGPLEARLQHFDLTILGGLNEGTWPKEIDAGPWLSRPMRKDFGLQPLERRIGLSAQDFAQLAAGPQVILTRALRYEGAPSVPARWLTRIAALLEGHDLQFPAYSLDLRALVAALDDPGHAPTPADRPAPCPPLAARPRRLSVTRIGLWMHDPYALYAKHVLKLNKLDDLEMAASAREKGNLIHAVLERFTLAHPQDLPPRLERVLLKIGEEVFAEAAVDDAAKAQWWARFRRLVPWFARQETAQRQKGFTHTLAEQQGSMVIPAPGGDFTLFGFADRIDLFEGGRVDFLDYKTGNPPTSTEVASGLEPQLTLEAMIACHEGFKGVPAPQEIRLAYWHTSGVRKGGAVGEIKTRDQDAKALMAEAEAGVAALIAAFDDPQMPYLARPDAAAALKYNDYEQLARLKEWGEKDEDA